MAKTMLFEYKPESGSEIEGGYSILNLCLCVGAPRGLTSHEIQKIVLAPVGTVVYVTDVGEFRRTR